MESAFRTIKTSHLKVRPVYARTEASTRGHVLVVALAYMIVRELQKAWRHFDLTVEEGLDELSRLCATQLSIKDGGSCLRVPVPSPIAKELLNALDVRLPPLLVKSKVNVDTERKLTSRIKRLISQ